jgi:hypothetical protein
MTQEQCENLNRLLRALRLPPQGDPARGLWTTGSVDVARLVLALVKRSDVAKLIGCEQVVEFASSKRTFDTMRHALLWMLRHWSWPLRHLDPVPGHPGSTMYWREPLRVQLSADRVYCERKSKLVGGWSAPRFCGTLVRREREVSSDGQVVRAEHYEASVLLDDVNLHVLADQLVSVGHWLGEVLALWLAGDAAPLLRRQRRLHGQAEALLVERLPDVPEPPGALSVRL